MTGLACAARCGVVVCASGGLLLGCYPSWHYGRGTHGMTAASIGLLRDEGPPPLDTASLTDADRSAGEHVEVLRSLDDHAGEVLAALDIAEAASDQWRGLSDLRAVAARLGADAIADLEVTPPRPGETEAHFCAFAVRYQDVLDHRAFEVISVIEVQAALIDEAYAELRLRAEAMSADYLRNVQYTPPDASGRMRLRAEAIRVQHTAPTSDAARPWH